MTRILAPLILAGLLLGSPPATRADTAKPERSPEELVTEGVQMLMQAMQLFLKSVPQFGKPYVNDNGDIVIPRLHPGDEPPKPEPDLPPGQRRI